MRGPSTRVAGSGGGGGGGKKAESPPYCTEVGLKRGPWTAEEDELLTNYIEREGEGRWRTLPKKAGLLRCGRSCRLRWMNYLRPSVKRGHISADEEDLILRLHRLLGNRWSLIAGRIPGRTDNEIKNYWNTHLTKKLISQGIDPKTHKPFNPNPSSIHKSHHHSFSPPPNNAATIHRRQHGGAAKREGPTRNCGHDRRMGGGHGDDGIVDCCHDDSLSSFLNSLINDEMFSSQHQDQHQQ